MNRVIVLILLAAVPVLAATSGPRDPDVRGSIAQGDDAPGEKGERAVQIVYESDTRGYYLPCG